ncbi:MAG: hypothetical protein WBF17_26385 [Phycisphaerae bacterium]
MAGTLGTMFTWTTYGMWLRGDARGWVEKGIVFPPNLALEVADRRRLRYSPFRFPREQRHPAGSLIGEAIEELRGRVYCLCVASWHVHLVIGYVHVPVSRITKAVKEKVRTGLGYKRAIWAGGYDRRFCFDEASIARRIQYVRKHNVEDGLPPDPWPFIRPPSFVADLGA